MIRTSWVLSGTHDNFLSTMINLVAQGRQLSVVDDQVGSPTIAQDLADATIDLFERTTGGVVHVTNSGSTTWFELARFAVAIAGLDPDLIQACSTAEYPTPARRPAYSVLGSERIEDAGIGPLRPWRDAAETVVAVQAHRLGLSN